MQTKEELIAYITEIYENLAPEKKEKANQYIENLREKNLINSGKEEVYDR